MASESAVVSTSRDLQVVPKGPPAVDVSNLVAQHKDPMTLARALVVVSGNPLAVLADADSRRRDVGLWLAAAFTTLFFACGVVVSLTPAPAALATTCFGLASTSLGATFAIITDKFKSPAQKTNAGGGTEGQP